MTRTRAKAPTILDVAVEAGVSKSAVSRALLGQGEVSAATRDRIERAAKDLGYVANAMARGLVRAQTNMIGVVLRDLTRPFYAELQAGMQLQAESRGYQIVTVTSAGELEVADAIRALKRLISLQVDGLLIASARLPADEIVPFVERVPIVVAGRRETGPGITSVFCDDADGGRQLAEYLLHLGHKHIAVVLVDRSYSLSQNARGLGMIECIRNGGFSPIVWEVGVDADVGNVVAAMVAESGVTAIMCPTDGSVIDVLEILRLHGQSAPNDFAVTGYDGFGPWAASYLGLTTFRQPVRDIGRTAVDILVDRIEGKSDQDRLIVLKGTLISGRTAGLPSRREVTT